MYREGIGGVEMKRGSRFKRVVTYLLVLLVFVSAVWCNPRTVYATQSRIGNFSRNYTLTGNPATDICRVASAQIGRANQLGYTEAWCADFVSDCAILANCQYAIPQTGGATTMYNYVINAGGARVSSAQAGDLVFFNNNSGGYFHVGIMLDSATQISGNITDNSTKEVLVFKGAPRLISSSYVFVRPNYKGSSAPSNVPYIDTLVENGVSIDDAEIKGRVHNMGRRIDRVGVTLWENGVEVWNFNEGSSLSKDFDMWYNLKKDFRALNENTSYSYRFWCEAGGTRYYSSIKPFTTAKDGSRPSISDVKVANVSTTGFDVSCVASDNRAIKQVRFKSWTNANGEDDAVWKNGEFGNGRWSCRINTSEHKNEYGTYSVLIQVLDFSDNEATASTTVNIPSPNKAPSISDIKVSNVSFREFNISCLVSDDKAVKEVEFWIWTEKNGNDDLKKYMASLSQGRWSCNILTENHQTQSGKYIIEVHAYDNEGASSTALSSVNVPDRPPLPVITKQPTDVTVDVGDYTTLEITAENAESYLWQMSRDGVNWSLPNDDSSARSNIYEVWGHPLIAENYMFRCLVYNAYGDFVISNTVRIYLTPKIYSQPEDVTGSINDTVSFELSAKGGQEYNWYYSKDGKNWIDDIDFATDGSSTLSFTLDENNISYMFKCVVTSITGNTSESNIVRVIPNLQVTEQPKDVTASAGDTVSFTVMAIGAKSYQWQYRKNGEKTWRTSGMAGSTTNTLIVPVTAERIGQAYRCVITGTDGRKVSSDSAKINEKLSISGQPSDVSASVGETVSFTVTANGAKSYKWQFSKDNGKTWKSSGLEGRTTNTLIVPVTEERIGLMYRCVITGKDGTKVTSNAAKLVSKLSIIQHPSNVTASIGETVSFTVKANGAKSYQWQYSKDSGKTWRPSGMEGSTTDTLIVTVTEARIGQMYRCVVSGSDQNSVTSGAAAIYGKLSITSQPSDVTASVGDTVDFTIAAYGAKSYQWQYSKDGGSSWADSGMTGFNTNRLSVPVTKARIGQMYRCVITGFYGEQLFSDSATILKAKSPKDNLDTSMIISVNVDDFDIDETAILEKEVTEKSDDMLGEETLEEEKEQLDAQPEEDAVEPQEDEQSAEETAEPQEDEQQDEEVASPEENEQTDQQGEATDEVIENDSIDDNDVVADNQNDLELLEPVNEQ